MTNPFNELFASQLDLPFVFTTFPHVQSHNGLDEESYQPCQKKPVVVTPAPGQSGDNQVEGNQTVQGKNNTGDQCSQNRTTFALF